MVNGKQFVYKVIEMKTGNKANEKLLNGLGLEGRELVTIAISAIYRYEKLFLKREI